MKIILFSGTHSRHVYLHKKILDNFNVEGIVVMQREDELPGNKIKGSRYDINNWPKESQILYNMHFELRNKIEKDFYGNLNTKLYENYSLPILNINPDDLNSNKVKSFIDKINPDVVIIFGVNLIKDPVISSFPRDTYNIHLGLSPWYRGSATLFWPFYNLQPNWAGATIHNIVLEPDAGDILHHSVPNLEYGDTMHIVGAKTVETVSNDLIKILKKSKKGEKLKCYKQLSSGKNFLIRDFEPHHLHLIYDLYDDKIVDYYLDNKLTKRKPNLIKAV